MFKKLKTYLLKIIGDLKYYKYPMFIIYCPTTYKVKGDQYMEVATKIKRGDIVLRGYDDYVDGLFIPGTYTHSGIYLGDNTVLHAVAEGVCRINLIDFMRCDKILVLRPAYGVEVALDRADFIESQQSEYDFEFLDNNNAYYCHELTAICYKALGIDKINIKRFFGLYNKDLYLAESFINNVNFESVYEYCPIR